MNSQGQNIGYTADDLAGHAAHTDDDLVGHAAHGQMKRDEYLNQYSSQSAREALDRLSQSQSGQNTDYTSFLQQKGEQVINMAQGAGEQVKNMAQGAAEAVKSTLGMNNENPGDYTSANINNPTNPSTRI